LAPVKYPIVSADTALIIFLGVNTLDTCPDKNLALVTPVNKRAALAADFVDSKSKMFSL